MTHALHRLSWLGWTAMAVGTMSRNQRPLV
jgi:hypothetical protein